MTAPARQFSDLQQQPIPHIILTAVEQIRTTLGASGAILAVRDADQLRLFANAGNVPHGSQELQLGSRFTRECLDACRVAICGDAQNDVRIDPQAARLLFLKSAIAVPIQSRGSLIGIIELFSSVPSAFNGAHLETLQEISDLLAPILTSYACRIPQSVPDAIPSGSDRSASVAASLKEIVAEEIRRPLPPMVLQTPVGTANKNASVNAPLPERTVAPVPPPAFLVPTADRRVSAVPALRPAPVHRSKTGAILLGIAAACIITIVFGFIRSTRTTAPVAAIPSAPTAFPPLESPRSSTVSNSIPEVASDPTVKESGDDLASASESTSSLLSSPTKHEPKRNEPSTEQSEHAAEIPHRNAASPVPAEQEIASLPPPPLEEMSSPLIVSPSGAGNRMKADTVGQPTSSVVASKSVSVSPIFASSGHMQPDFVLDHTLRGHSGWVTGVAFTSGGNRLVSGSWDKTVRMWDVRTGTQVGTVSNAVNYVQSVASSRDGHYFAAENSSDNVTLWDATTGLPIHTLATDRHFHGAGSNWVYSIAFSPDGNLLASGIDDKTVRVWDVKTGQAVRDFTGQRRSVIYIAFSPDGHFLATGANDKTIAVWDVFTGAAVQNLTGHKKSVYAAAFSPDGRWLASASADKTVKIWDLQQGHEVHSLLGHTNLVTTLAFSPDGRWLASGSWDRTIKIWDVESARELQTLDGHTHSIYALAFDSRGRWIASGSEDGTINLWRRSSPRASRN